MKPQFTPGPWFPVGAWVEHPDDGKPDICSCNPADLGQEHLKRKYSEICANASLIAAAPDLYGVLEECAHVLANIGCEMTSKRAFDVLKMARGEQ